MSDPAIGSGSRPICGHCHDHEEGSCCAAALDVAGTSHRVIRLDEPRPAKLRAHNDYVKVGTVPLRAWQSTPHHLAKTRSGTRDAHLRRNSLVVWRPERTFGGTQDGHYRASFHGGSDATAVGLIREQPGRPTPPGRVVRVLATSSGATAIDKQPTNYGRAMVVESIICKECGRCRCSACAKRRQLPSRWICGNHCLLSSHSMADALSCMCCVKASLYHCTGHVYYDCPNEDYYETGAVCDCDGGSSVSSTPGQGLCGTHSLWSCSPKSTDCCLRWTTLTSALAFLPCLWFYLPLHLCAMGVETAYAWYYDRGCHCQTEGHHGRHRSHTMPAQLPSVLGQEKTQLLADRK